MQNLWRVSWGNCFSQFWYTLWIKNFNLFRPNQVCIMVVQQYEFCCVLYKLYNWKLLFLLTLKCIINLRTELFWKLIIHYHRQTSLKILIWKPNIETILKSKQSQVKDLEIQVEFKPKMIDKSIENQPRLKLLKMQCQRKETANELKTKM